MFCPPTPPSCLIDSQNSLVATDWASSSGLGAEPRLRIPTRAFFSDFCASAASGAARRPPLRALRKTRLCIPGELTLSGRRMGCDVAGGGTRRLPPHARRRHDPVQPQIDDELAVVVADLVQRALPECGPGD